MNEAAELYDYLIESYYTWQANREDNQLRDNFLMACEQFAYNDYPNPFKEKESDPSPIVPDGMTIITSVFR